MEKQMCVSVNIRAVRVRACQGESALPRAPARSRICMRMPASPKGVHRLARAAGMTQTRRVTGAAEKVSYLFST